MTTPILCLPKTDVCCCCTVVRQVLGIFRKTYLNPSDYFFLSVNYPPAALLPAITKVILKDDCSNERTASVSGSHI